MKDRRDNKINVRLPQDMLLELDILSKATNQSFSTIVRMIFKRFLEDNQELLDKYYEKIKAEKEEEYAND